MAEIIELDHYKQHRIAIMEAVPSSPRVLVEPFPRLGIQADVEINRVAEECPHPIVVTDFARGEWVRVTCLHCGRATRHHVGGVA